MDETMNPEEKLQQWYGHLTVRRVDLVGDYAGKELFLLEGDSLLLKCFSDPRLDFDSKPHDSPTATVLFADGKDGFQLLHAVYAVEHFLLGLSQRHCNYHIVFFDANQELCVPRGVTSKNRPKYLLARSVVRRHLMVNLAKSHPAIKTKTFRSPRDAAFQSYLEATGVYFIMCHDGANVIPMSTKAKSTGLADGATDVESKETFRKRKFRAMICSLISRSYNIVLINGLEFIDTKVMTMVVEGSRRSKLDYENSQEDTSSLKASKTLGEMPALGQSLSALGLEVHPDLQDGPNDHDAEDEDPSIHDLARQNPYKCQCSPPNTSRSSQFTEREMATLVVMGRMLHENMVEESLVASFLGHTALIGSLPLSYRRIPSRTGGPNSRIGPFLADFSSLSATLLSEDTWASTMEAGKVPCDVFDLVDGRLLEEVSFKSLDKAFDPQLSSKFDGLAHALCAISGTHLKAPAHVERDTQSPRMVNGSSIENVTILPFSNPIFDKHLASIELRVAPAKASDRLSGRIYREVTHWHNAKRRLDPKSNLVTPASEKEKSRALKRNQFFMAEMQSYAASLTNAAGKVLEPEIVTVSEAKVGKESVEPKAKATPARKNLSKKAMLDNIAAKKAVKDSENDEKTFAAWRTVRKNLDSERHLQSKYLKIKAYLRDLPDAKRAVLQAEVEYHLLCVLYEIYRGLRKRVDSQVGNASMEELFGVSALIWDTLRRLTTIDSLTKTIAERLMQIIKALDLPDPGVIIPTNDRKLAYDPEIWIPNGGELAVNVMGQKFQLLHCGPYMDRNLDSAPDSRVPFQPDGWQRKVLDELDAQNSVFVVAPTSAGKTFISFYAMEKILRGNDDSVLVYVAPTKALVNQIAAEIQARFKKTYKHAGKSVWAIHTRDYRINNPSGCQILVTVPHILQIMLLAPSNAKSWSPRVKYIIFDEIHSIGQAEDGVVWEQLLLLAPCPIIALSATVGNPEMFNSWLGSTQQSSGHQVTMIKHQYRYSDLRKFVFTPPRKFAFRGLADRPSFATLGLDGLDGLAFVHPVASLVNKSRGIPDDLSLEARDCLSLFEAMKRHATAEFPVDSSLEPSYRQTRLEAVRKADIIEWERDLKMQLKCWMTDSGSPFDAVLADLSRTMDGATRVDKEASKGQITENADDVVNVDADDLYATTLPLLCKLYERDALPAIFFNYDRHRCENIAKSVVSQLEDAETRWKETSPVWKAKLAGFEKWKIEKVKMGNKKVAKPMPKKKGKGDDEDDPSSKLDRMQDAASEEVNPYASFDPEAPVDGFHFAAKHKAEAAELSKYFGQMRWRGLAPWLTTALQRGIGVHHAGMNRKYRQVVEMLFRKGYLRAVIATGTLALGINMPCATVVFSGDSIFLTALNFRQAAGRAGRRGFDLLGNVVFQGISHGKICRLLSSRLPDLNGHFPVTTTLVLRLFSLLEESGDSPYAIRAINSLLSQPRLYLDGPAFKDQVLHHLRFSIEYLRRQDLLSPQGEPINFAGLTSHLYFTENSSFALNALIKGGFFHELCSEINDKESHVLRTLMVVMAHLFGRRPCREAEAEYIENIVKRSPSIVFLPPMPPQATKILRDHNQDTLQVFTIYVNTFVDQHIHTDDNELPLTGIKVGGNDTNISLPRALCPTKIRSSFVALSGHGDKFESISDLCRTSRGGVFLEEAVIPHLDIYPDESKTPLNAYLYDFFMHGDLNALEKANGVKKADIWFLLNDFSLVLATISASLSNFLKLPESDLSLLDVIGEGDETNNAEDDKFAGDSTTDTESTAASTATVDTGRTSVATGNLTGSKPKTKKKVAESWDDSEDEEEAEPEDANGSLGDDPSKEELERGFLNVYKAITKLRTEFDMKFRKIFA